MTQSGKLDFPRFAGANPFNERIPARRTSSSDVGSSWAELIRSLAKRTQSAIHWNAKDKQRPITEHAGILLLLDRVAAPVCRQVLLDHASQTLKGRIEASNRKFPKNQE